MNKFSLLVWIGLVLVPCGLSAQEPPKKPFVEPVRGDAQWIIEVQSLTAKVESGDSRETADAVNRDPSSTPAPVSGPRNLLRSEVTRSNDLLRRTDSWQDETKTEKWWKGAYLFVKEPDYDTIFVLPWESLILSQEAYEQFSNTSFPEMRWVNENTFLEWTTIGDRQVAIYGKEESEEDKIQLTSYEFFKGAVDEESDFNAQTSEPKTRNPTSRKGFAQLAWIDGETKRPIAMESNHSRRTYTFTDGEIPPLEFPTGVEEALRRYINAANVQKLDVAP